MYFLIRRLIIKPCLMHDLLKGSLYIKFIVTKAKRAGLKLLNLPHFKNLVFV